MAVYRRTARPRFTLLLLVLTSITLITLDFRGQASGVFSTVKSVSQDAFAPVQSAASSVTRPVGDFFQGIFHYGALEKENARLRQQLADSRTATLRAADAERERLALLDLEKLDYIGDIPTVSARVVSLGFSDLEQTVQIDRGRNAGVAKGMPVVVGSGLVGRVVEVSRTRATVLLVSDPGFAVGIRLDPSGDVGVAHGQGQGKALSMDPLAKDTPVNVGDVVTTSGLQQSIFPPQIPVGTVLSVSTEPGALLKTVRITPIVDLRRLTFVKVVQWSPQ
ncbi:MAG TPA: rod shape-determining protein MreC [Acidimicrobiales bacterium]|nr:rod shape-determining protein MreC [Acidimicrobiales bacterium]